VLRLKTRSQFQAVLAGSKLATSAHFAVHYLALDRACCEPPTAARAADNHEILFRTSDLWFGPMVPKRWAKRAVTRNAIKRQIYNVANDFGSALPPGAFVVRLRSGFDKARFSSASSSVLKEAVRAELVELLTRVCDSRASTSMQGLVK